MTSRPGPLPTAAMTLCVILLAFPRTAHAYLNPGSGSFIFQIIVATLLGGLLTVRIYWARIKGFFMGLFSPGRKK